jgi:hypothetical protein
LQYLQFLQALQGLFPVHVANDESWAITTLKNAAKARTGHSRATLRIDASWLIDGDVMLILIVRHCQLQTSSGILFARCLRKGIIDANSKRMIVGGPINEPLGHPRAEKKRDHCHSE